MGWTRKVNFTAVVCLFVCVLRFIGVSAVAQGMLSALGMRSTVVDSDAAVTFWRARVEFAAANGLPPDTRVSDPTALRHVMPSSINQSINARAAFALMCFAFWFYLW